MDNFTPEQIEQFLEQFFNVVGRRQYIGARYVPIFGRKGEDSIEWDNTKPYEPLTIVLYQYNSYTSRTYVPAGVPITDTTYWANTGNYNPQIEAYRREVIQLQEDWLEWKSDTEEDMTEWKSDTESDLTEWKEDTEGDLQSWETDVTNSLVSIARSRFLKGANILCVTDSWGREDSYGVTYCWMHQVCDILGANYIDLHQGATGYLKAPTFRTRVTNWVSANQNDAANVDVVLVCGSCNDNLYSAQDIADEIQLFVNTCNTLMPQAMVFVVPIILNNNPLVSMNRPSGTSLNNTWLNSLYAHYLFRNNAAGKYIFIDGMSYMFVGAPNSTFNPDLTHPTQTSHNKIARMFASKLLSGKVDHFAQWLQNPTVYAPRTSYNSPNEATVSTKNCAIRVYEDHININCFYRVQSMCPVTGNVFTIPLPYVGFFALPTNAKYSSVNANFEGESFIGLAELHSNYVDYANEASIPSGTCLTYIDCLIYNPNNTSLESKSGFIAVNIDVPLGFLR